MEYIDLVAVVFKHGKDDYGLWQLDIPRSEKKKIMDILNKYDTTGCSIRGTATEIAEEF